MLWYCRFSWHSGTTANEVRRRVVECDRSGTNHPEMIRGWYNLAGGGAGFLMIECNDPRQLNEILEPYMDLMSFDVHGCYELPYRETINSFQQKLGAGAGTRR